MSVMAGVMSRLSSSTCTKQPVRLCSCSGQSDNAACCQLSARILVQKAECGATSIAWLSKTSFTCASQRGQRNSLRTKSAFIIFSGCMAVESQQMIVACRRPQQNQQATSIDLPWQSRQTQRWRCQ